ncbi:MAG TPA: hydroxysqualene dehydroxylase HpnE [Gaiellaceae bacterium]|nr:hydroxysqualene dehydroxylase HpnE [Gaiellaceae bacterium]
MKAAVVGGGLAGLSAALELVDTGHEVVLYEARPTLGGAVQTLPRRDGDPEPPPDNGQHIALACFSEYVVFLDRVGERNGVWRRRLELPVIDERGRTAVISPSALALLRYRHVPFGDRVRILRSLARWGDAGGATFADALRARGQSELAIERFWDVFIRPALNLPSAEASAKVGDFTVRTALLGARRDSDLLLPMAPLGELHGDAAGRALEAAGAVVHTGARVESLDELQADAVVVAVPPRESALLLGEPEPALEDSPIVSVHLWFDRTLLRHPLAALLDSDAHWVFDRGALTGRRPERGQYLTVVSSGAPELMELRGRELVDRIAGDVTSRLGEGELLWFRVSREPAATIAVRPGSEAERRGVETAHPNVTRAGAWTSTGWPPTMEGAVRSGKAAARALTAARKEVAA